MDPNLKHFPRRIKNCFVVLEPLDEKLLKEYWVKFNINAEPRNGEAEKCKDSQSESWEGTNKRAKNSTALPKGKKKSRIKPFCCFDENCLNDENISKPANINHCSLPRQDSSEGSAKGIKMNPRKVWLERLRENLTSREDNSEVDCEIEIIKEFPVIRPSLTCKKSDQFEKLDEDDFEGRDGEDDRSTVIFEEELHKEVELEEVFQEKEVTGKQLKNRKITNRKKQRLIKFKRKSMAGWNAAKLRKPKSKILESGQDLGEKLGECVNEEDLKEVCSSVKRLNDLCVIIQQLQRELPKFADTELAIHFTKVIHAQQENFHKELKKSQKIIMKCYDKMLNVYKDTKGVASEISKRTSLSVEDVIHIISRCILIEGHCDVDKSRSNITEKSGNSQHRVVCDSLQKLPKVINRSQMTTTTSGKVAVGGSVTQPQGCGIQPVDCPQGANCSFHEPLAMPSGMRHSGRWEGDFQRKQNCDPNTSGQLSRVFQTNPRYSDSMLRRLLRPYSSGTHSVQQCNVNIPIQNPQYEPASFVPVSPVLTTVYPPPHYWYSEPTVTNQPLQTNQNCGISVGVPVTSMNTQIQTAENEMCLVNIIPTNVSGSSTHARTFPTPVELPERINRSEMTETRNPEESGVLDPTIPQKLTMRNCRLQAGPVLDVQDDSPKESGKSAQRANAETDSSEQKNSRVYVCAQNDCKNPGVKICSSCRSVIYCSGTCQLKHWIQKHKVECYQLKKLRG